ncbi:hypothetical protein OZX68_07155 [Streptococcaceae bacterium ESL0729]|nr:hypothetical protein OZX68_07155 [Streptococcaceae bacterium ESL0729]
MKKKWKIILGLSTMLLVAGFSIYRYDKSMQPIKEKQAELQTSSNLSEKEVEKREEAQEYRKLAEEHQQKAAEYLDKASKVILEK